MCVFVVFMWNSSGRGRNKICHNNKEKELEKEKEWVLVRDSEWYQVLGSAMEWSGGWINGANEANEANEAYEPLV